MNVLPKGMFTVVVATVIASVLILFTGNSVADGTNEKAAKTDLTKDQKVEIVISDDVSNQVVTSNIQIESTAKKTDSAVSRTVEAMKVTADKKDNKLKLPPPGPFQFANKNGESQASADAPKAPEKQTLDTIAPNKPKMQAGITQEPKLAAPKPRLGISQPNITGAAPTISSVPVKAAVPEFNKTIPSIPTVNSKSPISPTMQQTAPAITIPNMNVQQFMPNQPIWMQAPPTISGGVPNFQGMAPQVPRQMQNAPSQNRPAYMQGMNMRQGQQQQRYMYMPAYPPRVYYPQMPRYNNYPQNMNNFMPHGHQYNGNKMGMRNMNHPGIQHAPKNNSGVKTQ